MIKTVYLGRFATANTPVTFPIVNLLVRIGNFQLAEKVPVAQNLMRLFSYTDRITLAANEAPCSDLGDLFSLSLNFQIDPSLFKAQRSA